MGQPVVHSLSPDRVPLSHDPFCKGYVEKAFKLPANDEKLIQLDMVVVAIAGVALAAHLVLAFGRFYNDEARRAATLATFLPSARPAFQPISSDVFGYWLFIAAGFLCALGATFIWLQWVERHSLTMSRAHSLARSWLLTTTVALVASWSLPKVLTGTNGQAVDFLGGSWSVDAVLASSSLVISIAVCGIVAVYTRSASAAQGVSFGRLIPGDGPFSGLLLTALISVPFLLPAYFQSTDPCGDWCRLDWGTVIKLVGIGLLFVFTISSVICFFSRKWSIVSGLAIAEMIPQKSRSLGTWRAMLIFAIGCAVAFILLWIPDGWQPVGDAFGWDRLFHWNYTVVGPTLGILHGATPGVDIVAHHGLGLPVGISWLTRLGLEFTYANLVRVQMIGSVLSFGLLAILLRLVFSSIVWTTAAFILALGVQFAGGWAAGTFVWWHPQLGFLRNPLEVALLISIVQHHRSGSYRWLVCGVVLAGISLWWVTDTGLINTSLLAIYVAIRRGLNGTYSNSELVRIAGSVAAVIGFVALVFLGIVFATVRLTIFDSVFWGALMEGPLLYGRAGLYARTLDPFSLETAHLYLTPATYVALAAGVFGRTMFRRPLVNGPLLLVFAVWGLLLFQHFIRGSEPSYWFRHSMPWAIVVTFLLAQISAWSVSWRSIRGGKTSLGTVWPALWLLILGFVVVVVSFLDYPNVLSRGEREAGECWRMAKAPWCVGGERARPDLPDPLLLERGVLAIQRLVPVDERAPVISPLDVLYLYLAERGPFWRHLPLDHQPPTPASLERTLQRLIDRNPDYVFLDRTFHLGSNTALLGTDELAEELESALGKVYEFTEQAGYLEVWHRLNS